MRAVISEACQGVADLTGASVSFSETQIPHIIEWLAEETGDFIACRSVERIHASSLSPVSFLRDYVKPGKPVIIEGMLHSAQSGFNAMRKWTLQYMLEVAGNDLVCSRLTEILNLSSVISNCIFI